MSSLANFCNFFRARVLVGAALSVFISACGGPGGDDGATTPPVAGQTPAKVVLVSSKSALKSDGSDNTTITATVLDAGNRVISGVSVGFSSTSGQVVAAGSVTDTSGNLTATFSAGADRSNRTDTISATTSNGVSAQIPVTVTGTQISVAAQSTTVAAPGGTTTLVVTLKDAAGNAISSQDIALSVSGTGSASLSDTLVRSGETVTLTANTAGSVKVSASALNTEASTDFVLTGGTSAFGFSSPATSPTALTTATVRAIAVNAPGVPNVRFTTTLGTLSDPANAANSGSTIVVAVSNGVASASFRSDLAGIATVSAQDLVNISRNASTVFAISPPVSEAATITLQASPSTVQVSSGTRQNSLTVKAKVVNAANQPVANVPVSFSLENPVGGGEYLSTALAYTASTNDNGLGVGEVSATFTSGTLKSSSTGINIVAKVVGSSPELVAKTPVVIGGTAASVTIGQGNKIEATDQDTGYRLPMSIQVADDAGNPVSGATVTLRVAPYGFSTGNACVPIRTFIAEDYVAAWSGVADVDGADAVPTIPQSAQGNNTRDAGEDGVRVEISNSSFTRSSCASPLFVDSNNNQVPYACRVATGSSTTVFNSSDPWNLLRSTLDNIVTPGQSSAGTLPSTVTTDSRGLATFNFNYLKTNAIWTVVKVTATTTVGGSETSQSVVFRLAALQGDVSPCTLPPSPYVY